MTQKEFFVRFKTLIDRMYETTTKKNADYAESHDAFANFIMIEHLTAGRVSTEIGIVTRLTDKLKRICSLLSRSPEVNNEGILDTILDMAVYSIILYIWMENKNGMDIRAKTGVPQELREKADDWETHANSWTGTPRKS